MKTEKYKHLIVGNWKMNPFGLQESKKIFLSIRKAAGKLSLAQTVVCPPSVFLSEMSRLVSGHRCVLGAQNAFTEEVGAYTGEVSAVQCKNAGAEYVILGHSERRAQGESDGVIAEKVRAALRAGIFVILCVGEAARDSSGDYLAFVEQELSRSLAGVEKKSIGKLIIAYEPIWAIGEKAKRSAEPADILEMNLFIRKTLADLYGKSAAFATPILYGGSVNDKNAEEFLVAGEADGLLVGRASLDPYVFGEILRIADAAAKTKSTLAEKSRK